MVTSSLPAQATDTQVKIITTLRNDLSKKEEEIRGLRAQISQLQQAIGMGGKQLRGQDEQLESLRSQLSTRSEEANQLLQRVQSTTSVASELKQQTETLQQLLNETNQKVQDLEETCKRRAQAVSKVMEENNLVNPGTPSKQVDALGKELIFQKTRANRAEQQLKNIQQSQQLTNNRKSPDINDDVAEALTVPLIGGKPKSSCCDICTIL